MEGEFLMNARTMITFRHLLGNRSTRSADPSNPEALLDCFWNTWRTLPPKKDENAKIPSNHRTRCGSRMYWREGESFMSEQVVGCQFLSEDLMAFPVAFSRQADCPPFMTSHDSVSMSNDMQSALMTTKSMLLQFPPNALVGMQLSLCSSSHLLRLNSSREQTTVTHSGLFWLLAFEISEEKGCCQRMIHLMNSKKLAF